MSKSLRVGIEWLSRLRRDPSLALKGDQVNSAENVKTAEQELQSLLAEALARCAARADVEANVSATEGEIAKLESERGALLVSCEAQEVELALAQEAPPDEEIPLRKEIQEIDRKIRFFRARVRGLTAQNVPIDEELRAIGKKADAVHTAFCEKVLAEFVDEYKAAIDKFRGAYLKALAIVASANKASCGSKFPTIHAIRFNYQFRHPVQHTLLLNTVLERRAWERDEAALMLHNSIVASDQQVARIVQLHAGQPEGEDQLETPTCPQTADPLLSGVGHDELTESDEAALALHDSLVTGDE